MTEEWKYSTNNYTKKHRLGNWATAPRGMTPSHSAEPTLKVAGLNRPPVAGFESTGDKRRGKGNGFAMVCDN